MNKYIGQTGGALLHVKRSQEMCCKISDKSSIEALQGCVFDFLGEGLRDELRNKKEYASGIRNGEINSPRGSQWGR